MYTKIEIGMVSTSFLQCLDSGVTIKNATIDSVSQLGWSLITMNFQVLGYTLTMQYSHNF